MSINRKSIFSIFNNIDKQDEFGLTRLYRAARHGDKYLVRTLLKKGADPNAKTGCGFSPLHIAAFWGETEIVRMLLDAGADPNAVNNNGWTPLHSASLTAGLEGRKRVIEMLLDHKANPAAQDGHGWTPRDYVNLWYEPDNMRLRLIMEHLENDKSETTGHQPDLDKLGLCKSFRPGQKDGAEKPGQKENDTKKTDTKIYNMPPTPPKKPKDGQIPRHH